MQHKNNVYQTGIASYYSMIGRKTASGEIIKKNSFTAAHKHLPFGTMVKVTSVKTGASVIVRINDRGPFTKNGIIDLSYAAALKLKIIQKGTDKVFLTIL